MRNAHIFLRLENEYKRRNLMTAGQARPFPLLFYLSGQTIGVIE